jgi:mono/diheme cytochrome c family protein
MRHAIALLALLIAGVLFAIGCGNSRRSEPVAGRLDARDPEVERGRQAFMVHCNQCHPGGQAGLAPALNNKPFPGFLMKFQVRHGFGAMPSFSKHEINDDDLDAIIKYIGALRRQKPSQMAVR